MATAIWSHKPLFFLHLDSSRSSNRRGSVLQFCTTFSHCLRCDRLCFKAQLNCLEREGKGGCLLFLFLCLCLCLYLPLSSFSTSSWQCNAPASQFETLKCYTMMCYNGNDSVQQSCQKCLYLGAIFPLRQDYQQVPQTRCIFPIITEHYAALETTRWDVTIWRTEWADLLRFCFKLLDTSPTSSPYIKSRVHRWVKNNLELLFISSDCGFNSANWGEKTKQMFLNPYSHRLPTFQAVTIRRVLFMHLFYLSSRYLEDSAGFSEDDRFEKGKMLQCDTQALQIRRVHCTRAWPNTNLRSLSSAGFLFVNFLTKSMQKVFHWYPDIHYIFYLELQGL